MRGIRGILGGIVVLGALAFAPGASAATLVGDYQLQNTLDSSASGQPALTSIGPGTSSFQTDDVLGVARPVYLFPQNNGLQMMPTGLGTAANSVVLTFKFEAITGYRRIVDYRNGTNDSGIYQNTGRLIYYPHDFGPTVITAGTYGTVAVTMEDTGTKTYFNGVLQTDEPGFREQIQNDTLRFFRDNEGGTEASAGAVSCIRVYNGALTAAEVAAIGASPTCGTITPAAKPPTPPASVKKKCKKAKKKKRAAEAKKKKKCKKKRKKR